jgi:hypothetical protein
MPVQRQRSFSDLTRLTHASLDGPTDAEQAMMLEYMDRLAKDVANSKAKAQRIVMYQKLFGVRILNYSSNHMFFIRVSENKNSVQI